MTKRASANAKTQAGRRLVFEIINEFYYAIIEPCLSGRRHRSRICRDAPLFLPQNGLALPDPALEFLKLAVANHRGRDAVLHAAFSHLLGNTRRPADREYESYRPCEKPPETFSSVSASVLPPYWLRGDDDAFRYPLSEGRTAAKPIFGRMRYGARLVQTSVNQSCAHRQTISVGT